jgi:Holliday junction resolvasome RuvABC DNA-binding subunit
MKLTHEDLTKIDGIADKTAKKIIGAIHGWNSMFKPNTAQSLKKTDGTTSAVTSMDTEAKHYTV